MLLNAEEVSRLLVLLEATVPREIDCSELLHRVAGFVERLEPGGRPPSGYEDVVQHLRICAECREEFEVLHALLRCGEPPAVEGS